MDRIEWIIYVMSHCVMVRVQYEGVCPEVPGGLTSTGSTSTPRPSRFLRTVVTSSLAR